MRIPRSLAAVVLLALPMTAWAQSSPMDAMGSNRIVSFGLGGGVAVPVSDVESAFDNGFLGQGFVRLNLKLLPIAPRIDFTFSKFDIADVQVAGPTPPSGELGTQQILAGMANLQWSLLKSGPLRPYVVAGVGAYNLKTDLEASGGGTLTDTRFGVNGGGGVVLRLGGLVSAYIEGRVDNVFTEKGVIDTEQVQVVPVTFGIVF